MHQLENYEMLKSVKQKEFISDRMVAVMPMLTWIFDSTLYFLLFLQIGEYRCCREYEYLLNFRPKKQQQTISQEMSQWLM